MLQEERRRLELAQTDASAFEWFYRRYDVQILLFLRSLVGNHDDAQELHDKVFTRALLNLKSYRWRGHPYGSYLHRIAANEAMSYWRARRRRQFVDADGALPLPDPQASPLSRLITEEEVERLHKAIAALNEADQSVLTMYYWGGRNTAQIAADLGLPKGTIQARLDRARDKLEKVLIEKQPKAAPKVAPEGGIKWLANMLHRRLGWQRDLG